MRRFVCAACLLTLLMCACSVTEQAPLNLEENNSYGIYQLTFQTKKIANDCVGDDWSFTYTYNGQTIRSGYTLTQSLEIFAFQTIGVKIQEKDKINDIGEGEIRIPICDGGSGKTKVTVTETDGRYKGNTAIWEITCEVKRVDKRS